MDGLCGAVFQLSGEVTLLCIFFQLIAIKKQVILLTNWLGFLNVKGMKATWLSLFFPLCFADSYPPSTSYL